MKKIIYILFFFIPYLSYAQNHAENITISGKVTDFEGKPIDSCRVKLMYSDFSSAYEVYTDKKGDYLIPNVEKGKYMALYAIRPKEYPRQNAVLSKDMKLEF